MTPTTTRQAKVTKKMTTYGMPHRRRYFQGEEAPSEGEKKGVIDAGRYDEIITNMKNTEKSVRDVRM